MDLIHFLRPWWLLLSAAGFLIFLKPRVGASSLWSKVIDKKLLPHLLKDGSLKPASLFTRMLWPVFIISLSIAMAGPSWQKIPEHESFKKAPIIIALEVSEHMLAKDINPSRLKRAIYKIEDLLKSYQGAEISLVAFAGDAHIVVPLSDDYRTILSLAKNLTPDFMPISGVSAHGLSVAIKDMAQNNPAARLLIMSSTNFMESGAEVKKELSSLGLTTIIWTFASEVGAPIGNQISKLKDMSGFPGSVVEFLADGQDLKKVLSLIETKESVKSDKKIAFDNWYDQGPYFLAFAMVIFLIVMLFDPKAWWFLALAMFLPMGNARAGILDWFLRKDQQAEIALKNGDPKKAASLFEDDLRVGSSFYKANMYEEAIKHLSKVGSAEGRYNLGNAYAKSGQYQQGIKAYDEALALDPKHEDAKANKELLEKLLKEEKKEEQKQQDQQQKDQQQKEQQEQKKDQSEQKDQQKQQEQEQQPKKSSEEKNSEQKEPESGQGQKEGKALDEKKKEEKPGSKLSKEAQYRLENLGEDNNSYLKRKFLYESQIRKRKAP